VILTTCSKSPPTELSALDIFKDLYRLGAKTLRRLAARIDAGLASDENDPMRSVDLDHLGVGGRLRHAVRVEYRSGFAGVCACAVPAAPTKPRP
jgi:hypothetical protein